MQRQLFIQNLVEGNRYNGDHSYWTDYNWDTSDARIDFALKQLHAKWPPAQYGKTHRMQFRLEERIIQTTKEKKRANKRFEPREKSNPEAVVSRRV